MTTDNDQLDEQSEEQTTETDAPETPQDAQGDEATEPAEDADETDLVRSLRSESRSRKEKVRSLEARLSELETELAEHRRFRVEQTVAEVAGSNATGRSMENPADLLDFVSAENLVDDAGRPDPEKIGAAIDDLLSRKPHLRRRWGSADGGVRGKPVAPPESLGALIGAAARGYDR